MVDEGNDLLLSRREKGSQSGLPMLRSENSDALEHQADNSGRATELSTRYAHNGGHQFVPGGVAPHVASDTGFRAIDRLVLLVEDPVRNNAGLGHAGQDLAHEVAAAYRRAVDKHDVRSLGCHQSRQVVINRRRPDDFQSLMARDERCQPVSVETNVPENQHADHPIIPSCLSTRGLVAPGPEARTNVTVLQRIQEWLEGIGTGTQKQHYLRRPR